MDRTEGWRTWLIPWLILVLAAVVRLPVLDVRPLHNDEGSNAIFILALVREGIYHYDPANYHGPVLYYLSALPIAWLGVTTFALRLVPALLGTLMAPLAWLLRGVLGRRGAATSGLLLAVSPSMVYYSRDNIHEIYLAFFTLLLIVGLAKGCGSERPVWMVVAGGAVGALLGTKETAVLTLAAIGTALLVSERAGLPRPRARSVGAALLAAVAIVVLLYSRAGADPRALLDPLRALRIWGGRALAGDGHGKPWTYFVSILGRDEVVVLAGAVLGGAATWRRRDRFGIFLTTWSLAIVAVYSSITYKTPWLVLNLVLPLALLAGVGSEAVLDRVVTPGRRAVTVLLLFLLAGGSLVRATRLAFVRY
ncbi:MAG TPA: flippase activity-associated protein Agl23, partial [Candidatus Polarisedimenticolia bacterium]|nr:flippase activity-associated protein Agl23 [Candidatus Polarisedimenticolia bacterium]